MVNKNFANLVSYKKKKQILYKWDCKIVFLENEFKIWKIKVLIVWLIKSYITFKLENFYLYFKIRPNIQ